MARIPDMIPITDLRQDAAALNAPASHASRLRVCFFRVLTDHAR